MPATLEPPVAPAVETPPATPAPEAEPKQMSEEARGILSNIFALGDEQADKIREKAKADKAAAAKPPEPEKKAEAPPATTETPAAATEAEKPKGKPRKPSPPAVDPVDLAVQTARETARAMGQELGASLLKNQERREASRTERADTAAVETLTPKQRSKHEVLVEMAKAQPDRYAALPGEYLNSLKAADAYKAEWQKQNPGKRFDPSNEEHDGFFESVEPQYDEDDYADTRAEIKLRPIKETLKTTEKLAEKLTKIEEQEEVRRVEPVASQAGMAAAVEVLRQIDPALPDKLKTPEAIKASQEADPDVHEIVVTHARRAGELVSVGIKILESAGRGIDRNAPDVQAFFNAKNSIERQIKALPREDQLDPQGRRFATWDEYVALPEADRERHWFLDQRNIAAAIPAAESNLAKAKIAELNDGFDKRAAARGYVKNPAVPPATHTNGEAKVEPKPTAKPPESPSAPAGKVQVSTTTTDSTNVVPEWKQRLIARFKGE